MANVIAELGIRTAWVSAGVGDTFTVNLDASRRLGVQIASSGFLLDAAVIKVLGQGSTDLKTVAAVTGAGSLELVGEGFKLSQVQISGIPAGNYFVCVTQP